MLGWSKSSIVNSIGKEGRRVSIARIKRVLKIVGSIEMVAVLYWTWSQVGRDGRLKDDSMRAQSSSGWMVRDEQEDGTGGMADGTRAGSRKLESYTIVKAEGLHESLHSIVKSCECQ